ncbi:hypothetical protein ES708_21199 [subsurface metagenome]
MSKSLINKKANFGTFEVFVTSISTILGAILFLKFGWAVGNHGFITVVGIILIGHLVTIPTAIAVAEIATNQKVLGGGAYYIISRSFGLNIGADDILPNKFLNCYFSRGKPVSNDPWNANLMIKEIPSN